MSEKIRTLLHKLKPGKKCKADMCCELNCLDQTCCRAPCRSPCAKKCKPKCNSKVAIRPRSAARCRSKSECRASSKCRKRSKCPRSNCREASECCEPIVCQPVWVHLKKKHIPLGHECRKKIQI